MSTDKSFDEALPEELKAVEAVLRRLTPNAQGIDRERMMYLAGRASVASRKGSLRIVWPLSTAALLLVSLALGGMLIARGHHEQPLGQLPKDQQNVRLVAGESENTNVGRAPLAVDHSSYFQLRTAVLRGGAEALPVPQRGAVPADSLDAIPLWPINTNQFGG
jgi:hypothetical protein